MTTESNMQDKELAKKKTLTLSAKTDLKKNIEKEQVRQSFARGRTKTVEVEVRKKKGASQNNNDKSSADPYFDIGDLPESLKGLTQDEVGARLKAVKSALIAQAKEAEKQANAKKHEDIDFEDSKNNLDSKTEISDPVASNDFVASLSVDDSQNFNQSLNDIQEEQVEKNVDNKESLAIHNPFSPVIDNSKVNHKVNKEKVKTVSLEDDEEDLNATSKKSLPTSKVEIKKIAVKASKVIEIPKKLNRSVLTRALDDSIEERTRSIASMKRARQKQHRKLFGGADQEISKVIREVVVPEVISVSELANRMAIRSAEVVKALMKLGMMVTVNQIIDADTAELICNEFGHSIKRVSDSDIEIGIRGQEDEASSLKPRAPVVTVMGHVDHGKTSLLDALRQTDVVAGEAGGITQHIGAYQVTMKSGQKITFIDTPGHAAFSEMRARGANVTDIVVLVVAADDGIMEQTVEAVNHAKAANVPIIVAINKIDKPEANPSKVKSELLQSNIVLEEFGGDVLCVEVSAKNKTNLEKLEEIILLQAEVLALKANPDRMACGVVVESKVDKGRGTVATVLIQKGTLKIGDIFVAGTEWGKVRALVNDHGKKILEVKPSMPVEVLGFNGAPLAGQEFLVVESENKAREIAEYRSQRLREQKSLVHSKSTVENMMSKIASGESKELPILIKADVQGSLEAISASLAKIGNEEVSARILHGAVGGINESDITLAKASNCVVIGFNVRANAQAREMARREGVEIRYYSIIYDVIDDVKLIMGGLLAPSIKEKYLGSAEVRDVFNITKVGKVAGCYVTEGTIKRGAKVRLLRDNVVIHEGSLKTLKRFKDEVKEVKDSYECGMAFENYQDVRQGDFIECFEIESIARQL